MDPSDFAPFNLGQILARVEDIKGARQDRVFRQQAFQAQQAALAQKAEQDAQEQRREHLLMGAKIIRQLKPQDDASWQVARAVASKYGIPLDEVPDRFDPEFVRGIIAEADALDPQAKPQGLMAVAPGTVVLDPNTRQQVFASPFKPEIIKDDQGNVWQFGGGGDVGGGGAPRGIRNNNAGNIEDGPFARSLPGYVGSDGRFAKFNTPGAGDAARMRLLGSYISRGFNTPAKIIGRWSPASENGASTANYINFVAGKLGIGPNDAVSPAQIPQIAAAIAQFENGSSGPSKGPTGGPQLLIPGSGKPQQEPPAGFRWTKDGNLEAIPGGPADKKNSPTNGAKLPAGELEKLANQSETLAQLSDLVGGFKDNFSGPGSGWENFAGRMTPEKWGLADAGQSDWWQSMDQLDNVVRNTLFGSALTPGEQAAWKKSTVTPNMNAGRIKANLRQRQMILRRALERKQRLFSEGGYNVPNLMDAPAPSGGIKFLGFE